VFPLYQVIVATVAIAAVMMLAVGVVQYSGRFTRNSGTDRIKLREIPLQVWVAIASVACVVVLTGVAIYGGIEDYQRISGQTAIQGSSSVNHPSKNEF
jgi:hypothetical protein